MLLTMIVTNLFDKISITLTTTTTAVVAIHIEKLITCLPSQFIYGIFT